MSAAPGGWRCGPAARPAAGAPGEVHQAGAFSPVGCDLCVPGGASGMRGAWGETRGRGSSIPLLRIPASFLVPPRAARSAPLQPLFAAGLPFQVGGEVRQ